MRINKKIISIALILLSSSSLQASTILKNYTPIFQQFKISSNLSVGQIDYGQSINFIASNAASCDSYNCFTVQSLPNKTEGTFVKWLYAQTPTQQCSYKLEVPLVVADDTIVATASSGKLSKGLSSPGCQERMFTISGDPHSESGYKIDIT